MMNPNLILIFINMVYRKGWKAGVATNKTLRPNAKYIKTSGFEPEMKQEQQPYYTRAYGK